MVNKLNKAFYNTALSQAFSPCGNYLAIGDIYGCISVFHLSKILEAETSLSKEDLTARNKIVVKEDLQVNSLITVGTHLILGGVGEIYGFCWKNIKTSSKNKQPAWTIEIPSKKDAFEKTDVNCLAFNDETGSLFAGCGDNNIYEFDLENRSLLKTLSLHTDYIHCFSLSGTDMISAGEDGSVNIIDARTYKVTNKIEPHKNDKLVRPELGKWIGAVSSNEDYILCGGGPRLALWHYRFLSNSTIFPINDKGIHVAEICTDKILAGGRSKLFYQMSFLGEIITEIPTSAVSTYSAVHQEEPFTLLSLAGSSSKVDICSNFMYTNQHLYL